MKLFKSKAGFTLIELLVVIGILAVLAAIAIPSVAGLIDRANVSADKTNANEMTNAIERFTSEYELYCQDIASGAVQAGNLDSAQGRVYNVLGGATTRAEITALEKPATAGPETTGRAIYRDTKYPVNAETMQAIVENYTKTSSATFEPKQSDMHFWYSPDCGVVVYAVPEASVTDLNKQVISNMDAKGNELSASTRWIDLTLGVSLGASNPPSETVIGSATFNMETTDGCDCMEFLDYHCCFVSTATTTLTWEELQLPENGEKYGYRSSSISNSNIGDSAFYCCKGLTNIVMPNTVKNIGIEAFDSCENLSNATLPEDLTTISETLFSGCYSLNNIVIPETVTSIGYRAFWGCDSLTNIILPEGINSIGDDAFSNCYNLQSVTIPNGITTINAFGSSGITSIYIPTSITSIQDCAFYNCYYLTTINYAGTIQQWESIPKGEDWHFNIATNEVICSNGTTTII